MSPNRTFSQREVVQDLAPTGFGDGIERIRRGGGSCHESKIHSDMGICQELSSATQIGRVSRRQTREDTEDTRNKNF